MSRPGGVHFVSPPSHVYATDHAVTPYAPVLVSAQNPWYNYRDGHNIHNNYVHGAQAWPSSWQPYLNPAVAVGLPPPDVHNQAWRSQWRTFPLAVFRGDIRSILKIRSHWDDERLLKELSRKYDELRTVWRKLFSLKGLKTIVMVPDDVSLIHVYPQKVFPDPSISKGLRFRYYLRHTEKFRHRWDFMACLTASSQRGIQFTEQWQASRIVIAVVTAVACTLITGVLYARFGHNVSTAFTIAGYMTGALAVICILVGVLKFVEFK